LILKIIQLKKIDMSAKIFTVSELLKNLKNVHFSELKKQKSGYVSWVNVKDGGRNKRIYVKTPKMFAPFGATNFNSGEQVNNKKFSVALSFKGEDDNEEIANLKTLLKNLDDLVVEKTYSTKDWRSQISKKKVSKDVVETMYTRVLREKEEEEDEKKYPALVNLKAQINWKDGEPTVGTKVYGSNKTELDINFDNYSEVIPKLTDLKCVFQVASVWFINKKFGLTLKLVQAKVFPNEMGSLPEFALDDEDEEVATVTKKVEQMTTKPVKKEVEEEESDDEEEEEEESDEE